jgi:hypothetical protein
MPLEQTSSQEALKLEKLAQVAFNQESFEQAQPIEYKGLNPGQALLDEVNLLSKANPSFFRELQSDLERSHQIGLPNITLTMDGDGSVDIFAKEGNESLRAISDRPKSFLGEDNTNAAQDDQQKSLDMLKDSKGTRDQHR